MVALPDFHENTVGVRILFHQASPASLPSGCVTPVKYAIMSISDQTATCLLVSDGACSMSNPSS